MPNPGRRTPPPVPMGEPPSIGRIWTLLLDLWKHVVNNHIGVPGGFFAEDPSDLDANREPGPGTEASGWAAADHVHALVVGPPTNATGTAASEGSGAALMRASATIKQGIVTTKGDVLTFSTVPARLAVGADDSELISDSTQATGLRWRTAADSLKTRVALNGSLVGTRQRINFISTDAIALTVTDDSVNNEIDVTIDTQPAVPRWKKYTVTHTALQAAAMANDIQLFSAVAGSIIHGVKIRHTVQFAGTGITDYKISVGIVGNLTKYATAFDVDTAPSGTNFQLSSTVGSEDHTTPVSIRVAATSTGANLDQSTAGSVEVWVLESVAV